MRTQLSEDFEEQRTILVTVSETEIVYTGRAVGRIMSFVYFCLVFMASLTAGRAQEGNTAACNGDFDFYLILDT